MRVVIAFELSGGVDVAWAAACPDVPWLTCVGAAAEPSASASGASPAAFRLLPVMTGTLRATGPSGQPSADGGAGAGAAVAFLVNVSAQPDFSTALADLGVQLRITSRAVLPGASAARPAPPAAAAACPLTRAVPGGSDERSAALRRGRAVRGRARARRAAAPRARRSARDSLVSSLARSHRDARAPQARPSHSKAATSARP